MSWKIKLLQAPAEFLVWFFEDGDFLTKKKLDDIVYSHCYKKFSSGSPLSIFPLFIIIPVLVWMGC